MNTLVTYDSSSEDDRPPNSEHNPDELGHIPHNIATVEGQVPITTPYPDAPMVGPVAPTEISQQYDIYDDEEETTVPLMNNERDILRYLTQPTHPMTAMPSSPPGTPSASTASKFKHFLSLKSKGVHFNEDLARKSAFRNPAMLQSLMERAGLKPDSAYRTSLSSDVFDTGAFPDVGYKEALLRYQQNIRAQEESEKKVPAGTGKRVVNFTSGGISESTSVLSTSDSSHRRQKR